MTGGILQEIADKLERVQPSDELRRHMEGNAESIELEIGRPPMLYRRDSIDEAEDEQSPYWGRSIGRRHWGARCLCTYCGEEWIAGWKDGGIEVIASEDGAGIYSGIPYETAYALRFNEGEIVECPFCGTGVQLVRKSKLPPMGRTRRIMVQDIHTLSAGGTRYTVLVAWLRSRWVYDTGMEDAIDPVEAYVLDTDGKLLRLKRHTTCTGGQIGDLLPHWKRVKQVRDPNYIRYWSADAINYTKAGCFPLAPIEPETLADTTGEKTGLAELSAYGICTDVITYLQQWRQHRSLENLVKAGWGYTVNDTVRYGYDVSAWADLRERRPGKMLGMSRAETAAIGRLHWDYNKSKEWRQYREDGGMLTAQAWDGYHRTLGSKLMTAMAQYGIKPERAERYLLQQNERGMFLADTWDMSVRLGMDMTDPQILFPKALRETHDRLAVAIAEQETLKKSAESQAGFQDILDRYGHLEWSDGSICIRLPRSLTELVREGATLKHCVGSYGSKHISGSDVIFFVRHARRPERSWYTLDIRMSGGEPQEVQLHGYRNELAHGKELHIPRRVREFCDRWEREVLLPGWKRMQRQTKAKKKQTDKQEGENAA